MKRLITLFAISLLSTFSFENAIAASDHKSSDDHLLIEAGCKFNTCQFCDEPKWHGFGYLLQKGACIEPTYSKSIVPDNEIDDIIEAYSTITDQTVRKIDSKEEKVTIDFTLKRQWIDPGIKINASDEDIGNGGIGLEAEELNQIWYPDLYIYNISDYKSFSDSVQVKRFILLPLSLSRLSVIVERPTKQENHTVVEYTIEMKAKIYCDFDFIRYPMDTQHCQFRFKTRSWGASMSLFDAAKAFHDTKYYWTDNFQIKITFIDEGTMAGGNKVGFDIKMSRSLRRYFMVYYLPSIASVLVSHIGFLIPLTSIPGRAALLVTQFLSLVNIFIAERVSIIAYNRFYLKINH